MIGCFVSQQTLPLTACRERMFEARLTQGSVLKLIVDAMKDLVSDANFECTGSEISVQVLCEVCG